MRRSLLLVLWLLIGPAGCAAPLLVYAPSGGSVTRVDLRPYLKELSLKPEEVSAVELGRNRFSSFHLVQVRHSERPHIHRDHDLVVVLRQGFGTLFLGPDRLPLRPGSVAQVSRGTAHYFINGSPRPAVAFVVSSPPLETSDWIEVQLVGRERSTGSEQPMERLRPVEKAQPIENLSPIENPES